MNGSRHLHIGRRDIAVIKPLQSTERANMVVHELAVKLFYLEVDKRKKWI